MGDVLPSVVRALSVLFEAAGADVRAATRDLLGVQHALQGGWRRVPWDETALMTNRALHGRSSAELEELGERWYLDGWPLFRAVAMAVGSLDLVVDANLRAGPFVWPNMQIESRRGDGNFELHTRLPPQYLECEFYFRGTVGTLRALPLTLGYARATVEAVVTNRSGSYHVRLPHSAARRERLPELDPLLELVMVPPGTSRDGSSRVPTVLTIQRLWGLTLAQARVARRLAQGSRVATIAQSLGVSVETVRTHLKRIYTRTGARRQLELTALLRGLEIRARNDDSKEP